MSEILFIRHAETDMAGTFCGHCDPELNARGQAQLSELINELRREDICAVYASDLCRARATGVAIAEAFGVDLHVRRALREINFGQWEGLTWKEIEQQDETYARRWVAGYPNVTAPGGESFRDFEQRVLNEVEYLSRAAAESKDRSIAVVAHGGVLRTVLCRLQGCSDASAWEQTRSYCSIVRHTGMVPSSMHSAEVHP